MIFEVTLSEIRVYRRVMLVDAKTKKEAKKLARAEVGIAQEVTHLKTRNRLVRKVKVVIDNEKD